MSAVQAIAVAAVYPLPESPSPSTAVYTKGFTYKERVISEDKAHKLNESNLQLYTQQEFGQCAITITSRQVLDDIVPVLKRDVAEVVTKRAAEAKNRARRNFADFGFKNPKEVDLGAEIATALLDPWFTKGTKHNIDPREVRSHVQDCLDNGHPINLAANMLPCKTPAPIKTAGATPDFSEVSVLCRLAEITGVVDTLCAENKRGDVKAMFNIVHDGTFFMDSLGFTPATVENYKKNIAWWINALGFEDRIASHQYTDLLDRPVVADMKEKFTRTRQEARDVLNTTLDPLFNPKDMQATMRQAIEKDPYPDLTNPEGRFVPLMKSVMYSVGGFSLLENYAAKTQTSYQDLYREVTRNIFGIFSDLSIADAEKAVKAGPDGLAQLPAQDAKEALRIHMAEKVWAATKEYMALTAGHRNLEEDLLKKIIGVEVIRFTIHPKPGQIGFVPGESGDHTLAWHGVGVVRKSHSKLKDGCETRLEIEGEKGIPVILEKTNDATPSPLNAMAESGQPFFYITKEVATDIGVRDRLTLVKSMQQLMKRTQ